jgi:hypothetical protein
VPETETLERAHEDARRKSPFNPGGGVRQGGNASRERGKARRSIDQAGYSDRTFQGQARRCQVARAKERRCLAAHSPPGRARYGQGQSGRTQKGLPKTRDGSEACIAQGGTLGGIAQRAVETSAVEREEAHAGPKIRISKEGGSDKSSYQASILIHPASGPVRGLIADFAARAAICRASRTDYIV